MKTRCMRVCVRSIAMSGFQGRIRDLEGGGAKIFFFRFGNLHVAKRHAVHAWRSHALFRGFGGMHSREKNF